MRAFWTSVVVVALAGTAAIWGCKKSGDAVTTKPPPAPVTIPLATVAEAPTPELLTLTGMVAADQRAEVTADTQGKVINVMVERGQRLKQGDPVVQLDVRTAALSAREAQANVAGARAQRQLAEEECKRAQALLDKGAITRSEYDRQTTQCTSALQQVAAAEARAAMMSKTVADGIVRAPFDGVVGEKDVSPGEWVAPGKPLFTLVDDDPLKVELSVPEVAVRAVKLDQDVEVVAVSNPDQKVHAKITRVGAEIGRTRSLIVEATLDKGSDLKPGMFVEARLTIGSSVRPIVPKDALVKRGKTWHVFVVEKGELHEQIVQRGPDLDGNVAVLDNLKKGDKVAAKVTEQVIDGLRVVE